MTRCTAAGRAVAVGRPRRGGRQPAQPALLDGPRRRGSMRAICRAAMAARCVRSISVSAVSRRDGRDGRDGARAAVARQRDRRDGARGGPSGAARSSGSPPPPPRPGRRAARRLTRVSQEGSNRPHAVRRPRGQAIITEIHKNNPSLPSGLPASTLLIFLFFCACPSLIVLSCARRSGLARPAPS